MLLCSVRFYFWHIPKSSRGNWSQDRKCRTFLYHTFHIFIYLLSFSFQNHLDLSGLSLLVFFILVVLVYSRYLKPRRKIGNDQFRLQSWLAGGADDGRFRFWSWMRFLRSRMDLLCFPRFLCALLQETLILFFFTFFLGWCSIRSCVYKSPLMTSEAGFPVSVRSPESNITVHLYSLI